MANEKNDREKIRPIYAFFQGCLSQAPDNNKYPVIQSPEVWRLVNEAIDRLTDVSEEEYSRFKLAPKRNEKFKSEFVATDTYRTTLGGLISELHGRYFSDELAPFSGMPRTVNIQSQEQSQTVNVQMLLEVNSKIEQKLPEFPEGTKERTFLQKVKGSLSSIKDAVGLIALLVNMAKQCGLSIDEMKSIFG